MNIVELLKHLDTACWDNTNRKAFLEATLAAEIAYAVTLPSMPVANVVQYFEESSSSQAKRIIGEINEMFPISTQVCYNLTVDMYKARYTMVHEPRLLSGEDIARLLNRTAVQVAMTEDHKTALFNSYAGTTRSSLAEFITRYVAPTPAA
jgi:hypothetical protein